MKINRPFPNIKNNAILENTKMIDTLCGGIINGKSEWVPKKVFIQMRLAEIECQKD